MRNRQIFFNGKIYTMKREGDQRQGFCVEDGKIIFCGTNEELKNIECNNRFDLEGKSVLPGFIDSHVHLAGCSSAKNNVNLKDTKSLSEVINFLLKRVEQIPEGEWIIGDGLNEQMHEERQLPKMSDIDRIEKNPVIVNRFSGQWSVINKKAMEIANITEEDFVCDSDGQITYGVVNEKGMGKIYLALPEAIENQNERRKIYKEVLEEASSFGITTLHTYSLRALGFNEDLDCYKSLLEKEELPCRVSVYFDYFIQNEKLDMFDNKMLKYGGYKFFMDGVISNGSAAMKKAYADNDDNYGKSYYSKEYIKEIISKTSDKDIQVCIHAIGDMAVEIIVEAVEELINDKCTMPHMVRIVHAMYLEEELCERISNLPITVDIQPAFLFNAYNYATEKLGEKRMTHFLPFKSLMDKGVRLNGGSDAPITGLNPWPSIYAAVNRKATGEMECIGANQSLKLYDAIKLYTQNASYCGRENVLKGTIEEGKYADFIILDKDPFELSIENVKNINVLMTFVNGKLRYMR